jgi:hypothetical protein
MFKKYLSNTPIKIKGSSGNDCSLGIGAAKDLKVVSMCVDSICHCEHEEKAQTEARGNYMPGSFSQDLISSQLASL